MATTIQIKRSSTASGVPLATDLAVGELAVNLADKRLFTKQSDGTIIELSTNPTDLDAATLRIDGVEITASATELNKLDGFTGSTAELNLLDGLTATTIELNTLDGITATTAELNKLDGYTGSTAELNILDGLTATTAELNYVDGVTSNIQTQLDSMVEKSGDTMTGDLSLGDSVKAKFGAGDDLQIYHDGSDSIIVDNGSGDLLIRGSNSIRLQSHTGETYFKGDLDGSSRVYYDNTEKIKTTSTGVTVTGEVVSDGLSLGDNDKATFGAGDDLQIYHDGSNSRIVDTGTGNLKIQAQNFAVNNVTDTENMITAEPDGFVKLFYNGSEKLATTSTGVDVTGTVTADGLTVEGNGSIGTGGSASSNTVLTINGTDASTNGNLLRGQRNGSNSFLIGDVAGMIGSGTGLASWVYNSNPYYVYTGNTKSLEIKGNGDVSFYEDTGTTAKFVWDSSAESLRIGTNVSSGDLQLRNQGFIGFSNAADNGNDKYIYANGDNFEFGTAAQTRLTIDSSGNVGIGGSPSEKLQINDGKLRFLESGQRQYNIGIASGTSNFQIYDATFSYAPFTIDGSGNVGIGTASPYDSKLHVTGKIRADGGTSGGYFFGSVDFDTGITAPTDGNLAFSTNGSERMRIDSSGNVGIGTASPSQKLTVTGNAYVGTGNYFTDNTSGYFFSGNGSYDAGLYATGTSLTTLKAQNNLSFVTNGSEKARIDASGDLLVGTTNLNVYNGTSTGVAVTGSGYIFAGKSGDAPVYLNRISNDGAIVNFSKDGSAVGSIGAEGGDLVIGTGSTAGLQFNDATPTIRPWNMSANTRTDGVCDLGYSNSRFKDLYLSGGVYLGGTGAVNKLDDYEEGVWTPSFSGGTYGYAAQLGRYTKVGNKVTVSMTLTLNSVSGTSGNLTITGLPFNNIIGEDGVTSLSFSIIRNLSADHKTVRGYINNNTTQITLTKNATNTGFGGLPASDLTANTSIYATLTYFTNA